MERLSQLCVQLSRSQTAITNAPSQELVLSEQIGSIRILSLNSPKTLNAISPALITKLNSAIKRADQDSSVKVIILRGEGRCFSAGADLKHLSSYTPAQIIEKDPFVKWFEVIPHINTPIIAAVHGFAIGGGFELSMMCDIIIAHEKTKFGFPEIKVGLIPGAGGTQVLSRQIGSKRATQLILSGELITASTLSSYGGFISELVAQTSDTSPAEAVKISAMKLAQKIASMSGAVAMMTKKALKFHEESSESQGVKNEVQLSYRVRGLKDAREGTTAFREKRKAIWTNE